MPAGQLAPDWVAGVRGVSKTFGAQQVLHGVALTFRPGKVLGLAGHNGSGKSTLTKCLAGYHQPDPGAEILSEGAWHPWERLPPEWGRRLSFVHQDLGLVGGLSAVENFAMANGFACRGRVRIDWRRQRDLTNEALERLGVAIDTRVPVSALSAVDRTMLAVARAFAGMPDDGVLVLDEPTATLTAHEAEPLFTSIARARDHGASVVLVTHHLDEIMEHTEEVIVLREGRVVLETPTSQLSRSGLAAAVAPEASSARARASCSRQLGAPPMLTVDRLQSARLAPLSLQVSAGEIVGVAGLGGSGRDDVAPLICGQVPANGGRVLVDGRPTRSGSPRSASQAGISYAPANRASLALFPRHSAGENVTLPILGSFRRWLRVRRKDERAAALASLTSCGLKPLDPLRPVSMFSGGNQQKAVLARSLQRKPRVLVLDEPTQGVDVGARAAIYQLLHTAAADGTAILVCSSDDEELAELCDRVIVIVHGHVAHSFDNDTISASALAHASLGESVAERV